MGLGEKPCGLKRFGGRACEERGKDFWMNETPKGTIASAQIPKAFHQRGLGEKTEKIEVEKL